MKSAMQNFYDNLEKIYGSEKTELEKSRLAIKTINEFLYTTSDELGETFILDQNYKYFSEFHKFWHSNYKEILDLKIDENTCTKVAEVLHDVFIRTNGRVFTEVWDTQGLSNEEICRVRLLTANQDFRGSRSFQELAQIYKNDPLIFDENNIQVSPDNFINNINTASLSQNDKRINFAKNICKFLIEHKSTPYSIISCFNNDVELFRKQLINSNSGYGNKKADMLIRDMVVLGIWKNVTNFEKIDVASDINTVRVALRTGILRSAIPLVSSFLDIFCYQYGYVDQMSAQAWRKVWEKWNILYPKENIKSPCLLDYFIYNIVGKQLCRESLYHYLCEKGHYFKWHSPRKKYCDICHEDGKLNVLAKCINKTLPCNDLEGDIAICKTLFVESNIANPNYKQCPFYEVCQECGNKNLMPPKSISILGQTGWTSAYSEKGAGGGGLMA